jgi:glycosyltransferase involved in cell wall biosynthesis
MDRSIDILMITHNRPSYTEQALGRLLATCDATMRVWVWHNGQDGETLSVVNRFREHPRLYAFYHSPTNEKLNVPTNWLWRQAEGAYLSKVDDDCLVPFEWADVLREAHEAWSTLGIIGCWRFQDEDFLPERAAAKIRQFGQHQLMQNLWVEGSGYLMKRPCRDQGGLLRPGQSFSRYCLERAREGWVHGWYFPFLYQEHLDDPRAPHSGLISDSQFNHYRPLSAGTGGSSSLQAWDEQLRRSARYLQSASLDPSDYVGWRASLSGARRKLQRLYRNVRLL